MDEESSFGVHGLEVWLSLMPCCPPENLWERDEVLGPILIQSRVQEEGLPEFPAEQAELQVVEDQASEGETFSTALITVLNTVTAVM